MASVTDVSTAHTTGLNHIDALLDTGPAWNYLLPSTSNTISYTFSVSGGNESDVHDAGAFSFAQQANTRSMLSYVSGVTGIQFVETNDTSNAKWHFAMHDIDSASTAGLCSWNTSWGFDGQNVLTRFDAIAYIYLDSVEWGAQNRALAAGNQGYETLLHEVGHALGLKHPFDSSPTLPAAKDNSAFTIMSYQDNGGPYSTFGPYDLAALNWLYGGDGLAGSLGNNSTADGRYLMGSEEADVLTTSSGNDVLVGLGGSDVLDGGAGFDITLYASARSNFSLSNNGGSFTLSDNTGTLGADILSNIERINFSDKTIAFDVDGIAGKAYRLYQAAFDRTPDEGGLGFWVNAMEHNATLSQVAGGFVSSNEFITLYGSNATAESIVSKLYNNVLHRAPEQGGFDFWVNILNQGHALADVLAAFSESAENQAQVIGVIQNGMEFVPFVG